MSLGNVTGARGWLSGSPPPPSSGLGLGVGLGAGPGQGLGLGVGSSAAAQQCVSVHVKNDFGRDAVQIAARNGSIGMLDLLGEFGGEAGTRCPRGDVALHLAASNGHVAAMRWLQQRGGYPEAVNVLGQVCGLGLGV